MVDEKIINDMDIKNVIEVMSKFNLTRKFYSGNLTVLLDGFSLTLEHSKNINPEQYNKREDYGNVSQSIRLDFGNLSDIKDFKDFIDMILDKFIEGKKTIEEKAEECFEYEDK